MRLLAIFMYLLITTATVAQTAKPYTFSGSIKGKDTGYLYMLLTDLYEKRTTDSVRISNGHFEFKGVMPHPLMAFVFEGPSPRSAEYPNNVSFMLDPGQTTAVLTWGDFKSITLTGAVTQQQLNDLDKLKAARKGTGQISLQADLANIDMDFIRSHPASYASILLLRSRIAGLSPAEKETYLNALTPELQQSSYGRSIRSSISSLKLGVPGTKATNFTSVDINGKSLSLADYKGRYVLLDFWASWCVPCRKGNPHLLEVYTKYKSRGFEIIGVSDDDGKEDLWRKAVEKDGISVWRHVLRGIDRKKVNAGDLNFSHHPYEISASRYAVTGLPTKILIDPSGNIVGRYSGNPLDETMLDKKLEEIFK